MPPEVGGKTLIVAFAAIAKASETLYVAWVAVSTSAGDELSDW